MDFCKPLRGRFFFFFFFLTAFIEEWIFEGPYSTIFTVFLLLTLISGITKIAGKLYKLYVQLHHPQIWKSQPTSTTEVRWLRRLSRNTDRVSLPLRGLQSSLKEKKNYNQKIKVSVPGTFRNTINAVLINNHLTELQMQKPYGISREGIQ